MLRAAASGPGLNRPCACAARAPARPRRGQMRRHARCCTAAASHAAGHAGRRNAAGVGASTESLRGRVAIFTYDAISMIARRTAMVTAARRTSAFMLEAPDRLEAAGGNVMYST